MVNAPDKIYVERKGKLELSGAQFISNDQLRLVIERIVAPHRPAHRRKGADGRRAPAPTGRA